MKLIININSRNYGKEMFLHENSDNIRNEILNILEKYVGSDTSISYEEHAAYIDVLNGELTEHEYPIRLHMSDERNSSFCPLKVEIPFVL